MLTVPPEMFSEANKSLKTQIISITVSLKVPKKKKKKTKAGRKKKDDVKSKPQYQYRASTTPGGRAGGYWYMGSFVLVEINKTIYRCLIYNKQTDDADVIFYIRKSWVRFFYL